MKSILRELINRFYLREMPALIQRTCRYPVVEGRATILVGIRRCGKTYRCYQYMTELLKTESPVIACFTSTLRMNVCADSLSMISDGSRHLLRTLS